MKVTIDGIEQKKHPVLHCTGYRAEAISLDDADLRELAKLTQRDLYATIQQLAGRVRFFPLEFDPVRGHIVAGAELNFGSLGSKRIQCTKCHGSGWIGHGMGGDTCDRCGGLGGQNVSEAS